MMNKIIKIIASVMPNPIKILLYRLVGYKIGKNVKIGFMTLILANKAKIGDNVKIGSLNVFKLNKLNIGRNSTIRSLNMMLGSKNLKVGKRVQIVGPFTFMNLAEDIELDDGCGIGSHSIFYTHGVYLPYTEGHPRKFGKIYLGKKVWSPSHVIFLPGVNIGEDSIISVGSVVNNSFPKNSLISGSPAKLISKADRLKKTMNKEELEKRKREILGDFIRNSYLQDAKTELGKYKLEIIKNNRRYLIGLRIDERINSKDYDEIIILGESLKNSKNKNISLFDLKKRKMKLGGEMGKTFSKHLETYGEYFN